MKFLIQVVKKASVDVDNKTIGQIDRGFDLCRRLRLGYQGNRR